MADKPLPTPLGPVPLGPFELERAIGRGGMAEVWLGVHRAGRTDANGAQQQQRVAVKVLTGERAREEAFVRALKNEIHNVARLHHPGIILLFEAGEVDRDAERISNGRFAEGSPWFAMELASHGSLSPKRLPLPWATSKMLLLSLLDALAHGHARGVIHRDIKPGNILLCAPDDPRPGLKLTDFGIAQPLGDHIDAEGEQGRLSGTPRYMAPEQFQAKWRDFGPWTDLYALGCIAYQLATGKAPFSGDALKLAIAHCHDQPEPPTTQMTSTNQKKYPAGYDAWVLRLLEKDPARRFACAADAAWSLLQLHGDGFEDEVTVIAGWEDALRSLKPLQAESSPSDVSDAPTQMRSGGEEEMSASAISHAIARTEQTNVNTMIDRPSAFERVKKSQTDVAPLPRPKFASLTSESDISATKPLPPELMADDSLFPPIKAENTSAMPRGPRGTKAVDEIPQPSTQSGPVFTDRKRASRIGRASPVAQPVEATSSGADTATSAKHASPVKSESNPAGSFEAQTAQLPFEGAPEVPKRSSSSKEAPIVDTTFAPQRPWTELAALSPKEALPTMTGRSVPVSKKRKANAEKQRAEKKADEENRLAPRSPPPMPPTWRRPGPDVSMRHLLGAGLGLYGLRQIPLVDRDAERDLVWDMLRAVHEGAGARVVVVRGPAGIGKTRLCEWLVERAAEVGAAVALRAGHGPGGGPLDGLAGLIALHARAVGLKKRALQKRLLEVVRRQGVDSMEEALALAELLEPTATKKEDQDPTLDIPISVIDEAADAKPEVSDPIAAANVFAGDGEKVRIDSPRERHEVAVRYLLRAAKERPVVAWLDDVQWGADAIAFARDVLDDATAKSTPLLILLSASEEELGDRPIEAAALDELSQSERVMQLHLPHLPDRDHKALVEELLGLEPQLAVRVAERTAGNPLFAVQLVGDFVQRGVLELTPEGFALKRGERAALPDDLHEVWSERITRVLSRAPPESMKSLELGAILGSNGDDGEWEAICAQGGVQLPQQLVDELMVARLVVQGEGGLRFAHAMLRESVLRAAAEGGRLEDHHRVAALMLQKRYGTRRRGVAERIGHHLVAASDHADALPYLLRAAEEAARTAGYPQAHALLAERDAATDAAGLPEDDARRAEGWAMKAQFLVDEGRIDEARMWAGLVLRYKHEASHADVMPTALRVRAQCAFSLGKWDEAQKAFAEAKTASEAVRDVEKIVQCVVGLSDIAHARGRLDESGTLLGEALTLCQQERDEEGMAYCLWNLAYVSIGRGEYEEARAMLMRQQKLARRTGFRSMIGNGKNALGDLERYAGRYRDAEDRYKDALRLFEAIGSGKRHTVRLNMAMNALGRGNLPRARELAQALVDELPAVDPRAVVCHGVLCAVCAHDEAWTEYDGHWKVFQPLKHENVEADIPLVFEMIGDHARARGDNGRAAEAYEDALELWQHLRRDDRMANVKKALGRIGTVTHMKRRKAPTKATTPKERERASRPSTTTKE